ncbi:MAG: DUF4038 domain-containing protein [Desulfatitalea sp.]
MHLKTNLARTLCILACTVVLSMPSLKAFADSPSTPKARWQFNESTASYGDEQAVPIDSNDAAVAFDGSSGVQVPDDGDEAWDWPADASFAVELWMKRTAGGIDTDGKTEVMLGRDDTGASSVRWFIGLDTDAGTGSRVVARLQDADGDADAVLIGGQSVVDGDWHHIVLARDAAELRVLLYVDGRLEDTAEGVDYTIGPHGFEADGVPLYIGWLGTSGCRGSYCAFNGSIGRVALYNSALTDDQVEQNFQSGKSTLGADTLTSDTADNGGGIVTPGTIGPDALRNLEKVGTGDNGVVEDPADADNDFVLEAGSGNKAPAMAIEAWQRWETTLTSSKEYSNPYSDVEIKVTYSKVGTTTTYTGYGYWAGGSTNRTYKIRFMFPSAGTWKWTTTETKKHDPGLHGKTETVLVTDVASSRPPIYKNGYIERSKNNRYLTYGNSNPFFWLGDTAWAAPWAAKYDNGTDLDWKSYVDKRVGQKFTVIQVHAGKGWVDKNDNTGTNGPAFETSGGLKWNPDYWEQVAQKVEYANSKGLIVYICAVREPPSPFPTNPSVDQVKCFTHNLVALLMGNHVVFSPVADDMPSSSADNCAAALQEATTLHLISAHPRFHLTGSTPAFAFHDKAYVDVAALQSGNGWKHNPYAGQTKVPFDPVVASQQAINTTRALYKDTPTKPIINQEAVYDSKRLQAVDTGDFYKDGYPKRMPRSSAYLSILSGSIGGITYGCGGVWNWGKPVTNATGGWSLSTALGQASANHMEFLHELVSSRGLKWFQLAPSDPDLVMNNPATVGTKTMVMAVTPDKKLAVAYLPDNSEIKLNMAPFPQSMKGQWFNPMTGKYRPVIDPIPKGTFKRPDGFEDAVLVLSLN